jgi:hypothetical protein
MRKPRRKLLLLACLAGIGLSGLLWLNLFRPRIDMANAGKIASGMSRQEVEKLLGGPAGVYASGCVTGEYWLDWGGPQPGNEMIKNAAQRFPKVAVSEWVTQEWSVIVFFDEDERVVVKHLGDTRKAEPFASRFRRWLEQR